MFRLPQAAKAVEFFGVSPADSAATVAGHLTKHANPTALDPGEQGILRYSQLRGHVDDKPLVLEQGFPVQGGQTVQGVSRGSDRPGGQTKFCSP